VAYLSPIYTVKAKIHYTGIPVAMLHAGGKSPLCLLCRVVSQIPLPRLVADLLLAVSLTSSQLVGNFPGYGEVTGKRV